MRQGSLAKVQLPYRAAIIPQSHKLIFPKLMWNRRGDSPKTCSAGMQPLYCSLQNYWRKDCGAEVTDFVYLKMFKI